MERFALVFRVFLAWAVLAAAALPCCTAYGPNPVTLVNEKAIIIWDPAKKVEHFIRQASFEGGDDDFGFIVPSPARPTVADVDERAFAILESLLPMTRPGTAVRLGESLGSAGGGVQILEVLRVGDYQATILKAEDGNAMSAWLQKNGYRSRRAMVSWLNYYAQRGWIFTALKFVREHGSDAPETKALRLSFKADEPFYPYKMPSDTWPDGHLRPLVLYFIAPERAGAFYSDSLQSWEARKVWAGSLPDSDREPLSKELKLNVADVPKDAAVTVFKNTDNTRGYGRDLRFLVRDSSSAMVWLFVPLWLLAHIFVFRWTVTKSRCR